jgi:cobaltochelatase CobS
MNENETTVEPTAPTAPKARAYIVRDTFDLASAPPTAVITGLEPGLANVPPVKLYVFEEDTLRQLHMFWASGNRALLIEGDPSAGKTSLFEQFHARLNVPLYKVPCSPSTETYHLIGQYVPREDGKGLCWVDGPVVRACREGTSLLLDEGNTLDPGVATGLNMLLEGYSWTIPETGETITPARTTRFFMTQNPVDSKVMVTGRNVQDAAFDDRWSYMRVSYLRPELEEQLIANYLSHGKVPQDVVQNTAKIVVAVANKVREAFRNDAPGIDKPLSTRVLMRWAMYTLMYTGPMRAKKKSALHYAINQAVRMSPEMAAALQEQITLVAGYGPDL